jgi:hypothetical protein
MPPAGWEHLAVLTIAETMAVLRCQRDTVYKEVFEDKLVMLKRGRQSLITVPSIKARLGTAVKPKPRARWIKGAA